MENLNNYQVLFAKRGGNFEVVGLDMHGTDSKHPFALRRMLPMPSFLTNLTNRQTTIEELANDFSLNYIAAKDKNVTFLDNFVFFRTKQINHIYNKLSNENEL